MLVFLSDLYWYPEVYILLTTSNGIHCFFSRMQHGVVGTSIFLLLVFTLKLWTLWSWRLVCPSSISVVELATSVLWSGSFWVSRIPMTLTVTQPMTLTVTQPMTLTVTQPKTKQRDKNKKPKK